MENLPRTRFLRETNETRMPRAQSLEGRSGQGRSREPSGKGVRGNHYVITFHAYHATPDGVLLEDHPTGRLAARRILGVVTVFEGGLDGRTVVDQRTRPGWARRGDPERGGTVGRWTRGRDLTRRQRSTRTGVRDSGPLRQDADACAGGRARPPLFLRNTTIVTAGRRAACGRGPLLRARELRREPGQDGYPYGA